MRDLFNRIHLVAAIAPAVVADNTAQVSAIIDRRGYDSLTFALAFGVLADADVTSTVLVEHGDTANLADATAVEDKDLLGTELLAANRFDDDGEPRKIGYIGSKRYVRLTYTPAGNAGNLPVSALAILGHASLGPTANPPA